MKNAKPLGSVAAPPEVISRALQDQITAGTGHSAGFEANYTTAVPPVVPQRVCYWCGAIDTPVIGPGSGPHYASARCRHCGAFLSWVSQYTPAERQARREQARQQAMAQRQPSPRQLAYLQVLGDDGPMPGSMLDASARIDALVRRKAHEAAPAGMLRQASDAAPQRLEGDL